MIRRSVQSKQYVLTQCSIITTQMHKLSRCVSQNARLGKFLLIDNAIVVFVVVVIVI